jgi:hypothetical protein
MKRERNILGRGELKKLEDENGRGRVEERESFRERTRSNIDSKQLQILLNCALNGLYDLRSYF